MGEEGLSHALNAALLSVKPEESPGGLAPLCKAHTREGPGEAGGCLTVVCGSLHLGADFARLRGYLADKIPPPPPGPA